MHRITTGSVHLERDGEELRSREVEVGPSHSVTAMIDDISVTLVPDPDSDPLLC